MLLSQVEQPDDHVRVAECCASAELRQRTVKTATNTTNKSGFRISPSRSEAQDNGTSQEYRTDLHFLSIRQAGAEEHVTGVTNLKSQVRGVVEKLLILRAFGVFVNHRDADAADVVRRWFSTKAWIITGAAESLWSYFVSVFMKSKKKTTASFTTNPSPCRWKS
jgi:hypothetical protein